MANESEGKITSKLLAIDCFVQMHQGYRSLHRDILVYTRVFCFGGMVLFARAMFSKKGALTVFVDTFHAAQNTNVISNEANFI